eukprot:CAMPEP_0206463248 /NCGR_PEP_ID=MMETSP0324_2-20121206/26477_1 /ASSEMBLY_ACC=CAM_ASM_000836 /TAXON_ID=2866 /ORGANISM="Crypthecodinium cohnii, Strain Seligo" /LENGTH=344 /DNA_ID=CAMNT_0053935591 /DNA_START=52 /DNA_END=1086 /DNA_ORIENTATION=+
MIRGYTVNLPTPTLLLLIAFIHFRGCQTLCAEMSAALEYPGASHACEAVDRGAPAVESEVAITAELAAGGIAGAAGILATQPLDTIRIRLQSSPASLGRTTRYAGIFDCANHTIQKEGLHGLYKGVGSPSVTVGLMNSLLFFSYEYASAAVRLYAHSDPKAQLTLPQVSMAGAASGFASAFVTGPTELVKCLAQTNVKNQGRIHEELDIFRDLVRRHGILSSTGPLRGLGVTIVRETPSFALYFSTYEAGIRTFGSSPLSSFVCGGAAGAIAWAVIYPLDVLKTRWQVAEPGTYSSVRECFRTVKREEGARTFFRGFGATMARAWPQNGVVFLTYELVKNFLTS